MTPMHEVIAFVKTIAHFEAHRLWHEYIDTGHVLLALVQTKHCAAYDVLSDINAYPSHIYLDIKATNARRAAIFVGHRSTTD